MDHKGNKDHIVHQRLGISETLGAVPPNALYTAIRQSLYHHPWRPDHRGYTACATIFNNSLSIATARQALLEKNIFFDAALEEVFQINSPFFWKDILNSVPAEKTTTLFEQLAEPAKRPLTPKTAATIISNNNASLYSLSLGFLLSSLALGKDTYRDATRYRRITPLVIALDGIADTIPTPPLDAQELYERMRLFFSPKEGKTDAYTALLHVDAFTTERTPTSITCPATSFVGRLFTAYGTVFAEETYKKQFITNVSGGNKKQAQLLYDYPFFSVLQS